MALFSKLSMPAGTGRRLTGFARYRELLERDFTHFLIVGLITLLGFLPFAAGLLLSILGSSILILLPACIIGGAIAGPYLSCMHDAALRSLRDAPGGRLENFRRAWKQNWRQSVLPGIILCLLLGFYSFMAMMFWWSGRFPGLGTLAVCLLGLLISGGFFTVFWPLLVLFEHSTKERIQNCILFILQNLWRVLGCAALQILYWVLIVLLLPPSILILLFAGLWFIIFTVDFLLYDALNDAFRIEEQIAASYPEQAAFYEDDEAWLKRKQKEERNEKEK